MFSWKNQEFKYIMVKVIEIFNYLYIINKRETVIIT